MRSKLVMQRFLGLLLIRIGIVAVVIFIGASLFDASEFFSSLFTDYEAIELDEIILTMSFLSIWTIGELIFHFVYATSTINDMDESEKRDPRTGLYNRKGFFRAIEKTSGSKILSHSPMALIGFSIESLKTINTEFAPTVGDEVINYVSASLIKHLNTKAICARISGNFFVVFAPKDLKDLNQDFAIFERVLSEDLKNYIADDVDLTIHKATAATTRDGTSIDDLMIAVLRRLGKS